MRFILVWPVLFVASFVMWIFRVDEYTVERFERGIDRFEDMLDENYPTGTVPTILVCTLAGWLSASWFGNDLAPRYEMNFASAVQFGAVYSLVILGLCIFAAVGTTFEYCSHVNYRPTQGMLGIWTLFFCASVVIESFALGYFIIPALI